MNTTLAVELRKRLERAIANAREVAEAGARAALEALAVHLREPYEHMDSAERGLRRRLRAHGRQVGDRLDTRSGTQSIDRLVHECAYEHWHGMLFARFLAENNLLIASEWGDVSVSLKECEELGKDEGLDQWAMAARFAHQMLPQVFRPTHRDYSMHGSRIRLHMFSDRIELYSPGSLPNTMTVDDLAYRQASRNETLTSLLARCPVPTDVPGLDSPRRTLMDRRGNGVPIILERSRRLSGIRPVYALLGDAELCLTIFAAGRDNSDRS